MRLCTLQAALVSALAVGTGLWSAGCAPCFAEETGVAPASWALEPLQRPRLGAVSVSNWERGALDVFVSRRLAAAGLRPAPPADRRTLARRLCLDLLGLPPDPELVAAFVADQRPDAYERLVDRLLSSPRFGERLAQHWLDLARYADSDGYHHDTNRAMWPYRDWVIAAFNANQPFDQFTIDQLAGDLLPHATLAQRVASAFHRNGPTSSEDGAHPEEYLARYAVDRVNTTSTVWLGLTAQCAECHDHKYDPLTTREYYQLFAFFNQVPEDPLFRGLYAPPSIEVPSREQASRRQQLERELNGRRLELRAAEERLPADQRVWEQRFSRIRNRQFGRHALISEFRFEGQGDERWASVGTRPARARVVAAADGSQPSNEPGLVGRACAFSGAGGGLDLGQLFEFRRTSGFSCAAWIKFTEQGGCVVSKVAADQQLRGMELSIVDGRATFRLIHRWPESAIQVTTTARYPANRWLHLLATYDGSSDPRGVYLYFNGQSQELAVNHHTELTGTIGNRAPIRVGNRAGAAPFQGFIDDLQFYKLPLRSRDVSGVFYRQLDRIVVLPPPSRTAEQAEFLADFFRQHVHRPTINLRRAIAATAGELEALRASIPRLRVMQDQPLPRPTYVLVGGDFRARGELVRPNTPNCLPPLPVKSAAEERYSRLDLARWLVSPQHPLTARVTVNRWWALLFGRGIVATPDDFGVRGAWPTHPQLLDWLAFEFIHSGWDVKGLLRRIVTSSVYRQSSVCSGERLSRDPQNALLSRGPRVRLPAETIRDNVLQISGLLSGRIGGPSVRPYQPAGLWRDLAHGDDEAKAYVQSHGTDLYRRGLYTAWKRSIHYPAFALFDAPSREICTAARPITNTPLQALVTLNDATFVEAARVFAESILRASEPAFADRLQFAFHQALARPASADEARIMAGMYDDLRRSLSGNAAAAARLAETGESPIDRQASVVERATWTALAQVILNLDEALHKE